MDIAGSIALFVEKDFDFRSVGAIAQADVRQHYDTLSLLRIARWLLAGDCDCALVLCALRHQLCPRVHISLGDFNASIMHRTRGGLTGSRVAGQLGRIPVLASLHKQLGQLIKLCWDQGGVQLVASTFVDNTFFLGASVWKATRIAELFGDVLAADWGQALKPTSKQVLATHGNPEQVPHNSS